MVRTLLMTLLLLGSLTTVVLAQEAHQATEAEMNELPMVNNKICPVSGRHIGDMGDPIHYVYNGKIYNLCCSMCTSDFKADPAKYSEIALEEKE